MNYNNAYNLCTGTLINKHICVYILDYEFIFKKRQRENFAIVHGCQHCYTTKYLECWCSSTFVIFHLILLDMKNCTIAATAWFIGAWQVGEMMNMMNMIWKCELWTISFSKKKKNQMNKLSSGSYLTISANWKWHSTNNAPYRIHQPNVCFDGTYLFEFELKASCLQRIEIISRIIIILHFFF